MAIPVVLVHSVAERGLLISQTLDDTGHFDVTVATRAMEALTLFTESEYSVAIVDFDLSDLSGKTLIRHMRGIDQNLIVVALLSDPETQSISLEDTRVDAVFRKPVFPPELLGVLADLLMLSVSEEVYEKAVADSFDEIPELKEPVVGVVEEAEKEIPKAEELQVIDDAAPEMEVPVSEEPQVDQTDFPEVETPLSEEPQLVEAAVPEMDVPVSEEAQVEQIDFPEIDSPVYEEHQVIEPDTVAEELPFGLESREEANGILSRLSLELSAHASLFMFQEDAWAYSKVLTEEQIQHILQILSEHKEKSAAGGAIVRFTRLPGIESDFLLYATPVTPNLVIAHLFTSDTPFSEARRQALASSQSLTAYAQEEKPEFEEIPLDTELEVESLPEDEGLLPDDLIPVSPAMTEDFPVVRESTEMPIDSQSRIDIKMIMDAEEANTPPPLPEDWMPTQATSISILPFIEEIDADQADPTIFQAAELSQEELRYHLPFTAVLLTRFPTHKLEGELRNQVRDWLHSLCIAWGWRTESIDVDTNLLLFTVSLSPEIAPAQALHQLAHDLSTRIMEASPDFATELPSGHFWAKRYLLRSGSEIEPERVETFVEATRRAQGFEG
ncbi:MAG: hypothetical protein GTO18_21380 [Anaerolineales bacterium]|nr:hypothetical protein [Anaerolineales bacterium]